MNTSKSAIQQYSGQLNHPTLQIVRELAEQIQKMQERLDHIEDQNAEDRGRIIDLEWKHKPPVDWRHDHSAAPPSKSAIQRLHKVLFDYDKQPIEKLVSCAIAAILELAEQIQKMQERLDKMEINQNEDLNLCIERYGETDLRLEKLEDRMADAELINSCKTLDPEPPGMIGWVCWNCDQKVCICAAPSKPNPWMTKKEALELLIKPKFEMNGKYFDELKEKYGEPLSPAPSSVDLSEAISLINQYLNDLNMVGYGDFGTSTDSLDEAIKVLERAQTKQVESPAEKSKNK